jgi:hypothetical protein
MALILWLLIVISISYLLRMHIDFRIDEQIGIQLLLGSCFATIKPIVIPASNALVFPFCLFSVKNC